MTISEASIYLGVEKDTLYCWVSRRKVPYVKVGRLTKFRRSDLDRWLDRNAVKAMT